MLENPGKIQITYESTHNSLKGTSEVQAITKGF